MRTTKALLLTAAISAVGLATSMAQVYSVNIVGYVNTTIPHGYSIICNPLTASPDNTVGSVMGQPPVSVNLYKFNNVTGLYQTISWDSEFQEWSPAAATINPGEGFYILNPGATYTQTFVGEVPTGTQTIAVGTGYNLLASKIPQTGRLQADLLYTPSTGTVGDNVYKFNNATGLYQTFSWDAEFQEWSPSDPTINVGEGFFLLRGGTATDWTRTFNVN